MLKWNTAHRRESRTSDFQTLSVETGNADWYACIEAPIELNIEEWPRQHPKAHRNATGLKLPHFG